MSGLNYGIGSACPLAQRRGGPLRVVRDNGGNQVQGWVQSRRQRSRIWRTMLNMLCISGGVSALLLASSDSSDLPTYVVQAKTHILAGNVAMEEVRNRIGGLHKALEVIG